jgi:hypothetical protein
LKEFAAIRHGNYDEFIQLVNGEKPFMVMYDNGEIRTDNFNQNNISRITCNTSAGVQSCSLNTNTFTTGTQVGTTGAVNAMVVVPGGTATEYSIIIG